MQPEAESEADQPGLPRRPRAIEQPEQPGQGDPERRENIHRW